MALLSGSHTVPKGDFEVGVAVGGLHQSRPVSAPPLEVQSVGRYGLTRWLDLGGRVHSVGVSGEARCQWYVSDDAAPQVSSLVAVSAGWVEQDATACGGKDCVGRPSDGFRAQLIVPTGVRVGRVEVVLAPQASVEVSSFVTVQVGGNLAIAVDLPWRIAIGPEVALVVPVTEPPRALINAARPYEPRIFAGLGIRKAF